MKNIAVAEYFIKLANDCGDTLTHLKLQKLVYYAQAWHIALHNRAPLFSKNREFIAWPHGPVNLDLYNIYSTNYNQVNHIPNIKLINKFLSDKEKDFLNSIADSYFKFDSYTLELMTQQEEPWIEARNGLPADAPSHVIIKEDTMHNFYKKLSMRKDFKTEETI